MQDIFRVFEIRNDIITELAFIKGQEETSSYLSSCNNHNSEPVETSYFAAKIQIQQ